MNKSALFLLLVVLCSCSPEKKLMRLLSKHPELSNVKRDTVWATVEYVRADTVVRWAPGERVLLENERVRTQVLVRRDTMWITSECKEVTIPVETTVREVLPVKTVHRIPWYAWVLAAFLLLVILALLALVFLLFIRGGIRSLIPTPL